MAYTALMQPDTDIKEYRTPYSMQSIKADMLAIGQTQRVEWPDSTC